MRLSWALSVAIVAAGIGPAAARAASIQVVVDTGTAGDSGTIESTGDTYSADVEGSLATDGTYSAAGSSGSLVPTFSADWSLTFRPEPYSTGFTGGIALTNTTGSTQLYVITVTLPVTPFVDRDRHLSGYGGPITFGDAIGANSSGDVRINTYTHPVSHGNYDFLMAKLGGFTYNTAGIFDESASGDPGVTGAFRQLPFDGTPYGNGGYLARSMSEVFTFELSAFDHVSFPFEFRAVPEPGLAPLVGLGVAVLVTGRAATRRRRTESL